MHKNLNNTSRLDKIKNNYFIRMMLPDAEKNAQPYVREEKQELIRLMSQDGLINEKNFIVIGAGTLWYIEISYKKVKKYIAIEPLANIFIPKQINFILKKHANIQIINSEFGDFNNQYIPNCNSIFVFHFNILSYITNPIDKINKYLKKNDILYISTWRNTSEGKKIRKKYFDYINMNRTDNSFIIDPKTSVGLCNLDCFPFKKLKHYKQHKRVKGNITDILIIYC